MQKSFQQTDPAGCSVCMNQDITMQSSDTGAGDKIYKAASVTSVEQNLD